MAKSINAITSSFGIAAALLALSACSADNGWRLTGSVSGAPEGTTLVVEESENGRWFGIDTLTTDAGGNFKASHPAATRPGVYRLRMGDKVVHFPVDSIETVSILTTFEGFDTDFDVSGSQDAEMMAAIDRRLAESASRLSPSVIVRDSLLKRELGRKLLVNPSGIAAFYIVNKRVGGIPLFNPANSLDRRIIGAVANAYESARPDDPRTGFLKKLYLSGRQGASTTVQAPEVPMFDIRLYDSKGREQSLTDVASANKVVVLNFTTYSSDRSTPFNSELHKVWSQYHPSGLEIYQVSVADEERQWLESSRNLPWISVYHPEVGDATPLLNYNVSYLPATFVIVDGELRERVDDISKLPQVIGKYL